MQQGISDQVSTGEKVTVLQSVFGQEQNAEQPLLGDEDEG